MYPRLKYALTKGLPAFLVLFALYVAIAKLFALTADDSLFDGQAKKVYVPRVGRSETQSVDYFWRDKDFIMVTQLFKNVEDACLTQYNISQHTSKAIDLSRLKNDQAVAMERALFFSEDDTDIYIDSNNHYKKPGMIYKGVATPSIALDADTTLIDFAASPTKQNAAWLLRRSLWPHTPLSQTQVTLLVQIGRHGPIRKIGSVTDWPKANYWPEANHNRKVKLRWSPDAKNISFVCRYAVYIMSVE